MDLTTLRVIAPSIDNDIKDLFAKHGLKVSKRNTTVDSATGSVTWKLTLADINLKDRDGNPTTPEAERWKQYANIYNLPADGVGRTFQWGGRTYTIVGLRDGKSRKSVVAERDSKTYVFGPDEVKRLLLD
jgi:hypothetical protein